jgi:hypothetical protein
VEYARQQELVLIENVPEHLRHSTERPEPIFVSLRKKGIKLEPNSEGESQSFPRQRNARFRETRFSLLRFAAEAVKKDNFYFIEVPQLGKDGNVDPELALHREWEEEHTFLVQYMNELILEDVRTEFAYIYSTNVLIVYRSCARSVSNKRRGAVRVLSATIRSPNSSRSSPMPKPEKYAFRCRRFLRPMFCWILVPFAKRRMISGLRNSTMLLLWSRLASTAS